MATANLLPLDTFRDIMGFNPWFFWQLADQDKVPLVNNGQGQCNNLVWERAFQYNGGAGREEIRKAIAEAERRLREWLNFSVAPHWVEETIDLSPRMGSHGYYTLPTIVDLGEGYTRRIGTPAWELVEELAVTPEDTDGDGIWDSFSIATTMPGGIADTNEVALFFRTSDRGSGYFGKATNKEKDWQIRPVAFEVASNGVDLTITGPSWLLVKPTLYQRFTHQPGYNHSIFGRDSSGAFDPQAAATYVEGVALYKRVITGANRATLIYDNGCGTESEYEVCATPYNKKMGQLELNSSVSASTSCAGCCGFPDWWQRYAAYGNAYPIRLRVSYEAGADLDDWEAVIARLAAVELMRPVCGCKEANQELFSWMADSADPDSKFKPAQDDLSSPFGNKRGSIYAWKQVRNLRLIKAISI